MKKIFQYILILTGMFAFMNANAQAPEKMNYQAVVRNSSTGLPIGAQGIIVRFTIHQGAATGTPVYQETQSLSTNQFGLFNTAIGGGSVVSGTFTSIAWGSNAYYLQVEVDAGSGYENLGAAQLLSVPYALYSKESANGPTGAQGPPGIGINWLGSFASAPATPNLNDAYYNSALGQSFVWDGAAWNIMTQDGTSGTFIGGPGISIVTGTISNTGDLDSLNELQTLSKSGSLITLSNGGGSVTDSIDDADADPANEIQLLSKTAGVITLSNGGGSVTDSIDDADNDPNNERITTFALNGTSDSIVIVEAGVGHAFPLSNLNDGDWTKGTGSDIFNNSDSVGIGTTDPKSPLQIGNYMHWFPFDMPGPENYAVRTFNAHNDGTTIRNTIGGTSGISFIGHETGTPMFGVQLFPSLAAGADIMAVNPVLRLNLKGKGLGINKDNPDAGLDVQPLDSAGIMIRLADNGDPANLFFEDTQFFTVGLKAPLTLSGNYGLTLPTSLPSTGGSSLVSDVNGNLSWGVPIPAIWSQGVGVLYSSNATDNVGIGTTTPGQKLHVYSSGTNVGIAIDGGVAGRSRLGFLPGGVDNGELGFKNNLQIGSISNSSLVMTNEWVRILGTNGNVGIGTIAPAYKLDVNGRANALTASIGTTNLQWGANLEVNERINITSTANTSRLFIGASGTNYIETSWNTASNYGHIFTNNGPLVLNNGTQNVGVGTVTPADKLHVVSGGNGTRVRIENTSNGWAGIDAKNTLGEMFVGVQGPFDPVPGEFHIYDNFNGGQRMVIDATGNVGFGTSNPEMNVHIGGTNGLMINAAGTGGNIGGLAFRNGYTTLARPFHLGIVTYDHNTGGTGFSDGLVVSGYDGIAFTTDNSALSNTTLTNVRMMINQVGNVGIGTSTPASKLHVDGEIRVTSSIGRIYYDDQVNPGTFFYKTYVSGGNYYIQYANNTPSFRFSGNNLFLGEGFVGGGTRLTVGNNGDGSNAIANSWAIFSDRRYKQNIQTIQSPLTLVKALNGVTFDWISSGNADMGFIAQDVEKVLPHIVFTDEETGYKSMDYARMTPLLIEAVKEQQKMIDTLKENQLKLEEEIKALKNK